MRVNETASRQTGRQANRQQWWPECEAALVRRPDGNDVGEFAPGEAPKLALHHLLELLSVRSSLRQTQTHALYAFLS